MFYISPSSDSVSSCLEADTGGSSVLLFFLEGVAFTAGLFLFCPLVLVSSFSFATTYTKNFNNGINRRVVLDARRNRMAGKPSSIHIITTINTAITFVTAHMIEKCEYLHFLRHSPCRTFLKHYFQNLETKERKQLFSLPPFHINRHHQQKRKTKDWRLAADAIITRHFGNGGKKR